jgi:diguanylate cyclase (GGDEF)-like protein
MRVVLVAADQALRDSMTAMLETRGHEVAGFAEANDALDHLDSHVEANAFLIANISEPHNGAEICWEARLLASFERPIYICLVTRPLSSTDFIEALDCGADDVLQLPLSSDELYARLRAAERFNQMQNKLVEMATRDSLSGLFNRPAFFNRAARAVEDSEAPLAAIMADIDHFKSINDKYGHAAGDITLRAVADCLKSQDGIAARLGGEEFAILLTDGDPEKAWRAAEALRRLIATQEIEIPEGAVRVTCSFGVAVGEKGENIDQILRKADAALYAAKRSGRNVVAAHDPASKAMPERPSSVVRGASAPVGGMRRKIAG